MKKYTLASLLVLMIILHASAQKGKEPAGKSKTGESPCCCKDIDPCFKDDPFYKTLPPDNTKDIVLDFRARALGIPKNLKIRKGDFIRIRVTNYNPLLYRVSVDNKDSSVAQPVDAGFLGMFLSPDKFTSAIGNLINTVGTPPPVEVEEKKEAPIFYYGLMDFNLDKPAGKEKTPKKSSPKPKVNPDEKKVDSFLNNYLSETKQKKTDILGVRQAIEVQFSEISRTLATLKKLYLECPDLLEDTIKAKAGRFTDTLSKLRSRVKELSRQVFDSSREFKLNLSSYLPIVEGTAKYKARYTFIDSFFKLAAAELNGLDTSVSSRKIDEMYAAFIKLTQNTICFTSLPIYIGNDVKVLSIGLKPVEDNSNLPSYQTSFSIPDYQPMIWGVSGGIYICGLKNETFSNKRKENDTTFNLVAEKQNKIQIGVNALAYMGWQVTPTRPNYLGICFGAGMSLESKSKPRVLLGGSFITGEKNRINVSAGLVAGYVTRLSDAFSTTANYTKPAESYQRDFLKTSVFFSINYSFISK